MSWFYEDFRVESAYNGKISCWRMLGEWQIVAGHIMQSGDYIRDMWKKAVRKIPKHEVKKVLVLGLGAGSCLKPIQKRFKKCRITAIEADPVMVELTRSFKFYGRGREPEILQGDAAQILSQLTQKFDLILWDLFVDGQTARMAHEQGLAQSLAAHLEREGYLIVNYYREPETLQVFDQHLSRQRNWRFHYNGLSLYRHAGRGTVGDPLPPGYRPFRSCTPYLRRECAATNKMMPVGTDECTGSRWRHGPWWFEGYTSDIEPKPDQAGPKRMVIWQPITRTDMPAGWKRSWVQMNPNLTGFVDLHEAEPFWSSWKPHALRHLKHWEKFKPYEIAPINADEFMQAYRGRDVKLHDKFMNLWLIRSKLKKHGELMHFYGARDAQGKIMAGFAALDIPEASQSIHVASFIAQAAKNSSVGVGLVANWFRDCLDKGLRFADFDLFWAWGDPFSWRGFSRFKSQFGVTFIRYPKPLIRHVGRRKA